MNSYRPAWLSVTRSTVHRPMRWHLAAAAGLLAALVVIAAALHGGAH
jgi:hypothetical protein